MRIVVTTGEGEGGTTLSAFDAALAEAGVADLNLLTLSSVIPPGAVVCRGRRPPDALAAHPETRWGDRLYCVLAEARVDRPGCEAWAGIGWWQHPDDGRGVFVEHHGPIEDRVDADLRRSLQECVERRGHTLADGLHRVVLNGVRCTDRPVCALVVATYETQGWG